MLVATERIAASPFTGTTVAGKAQLLSAAPVARAAAVTAANASTVDATYGTEEQNVINNMRIRLAEVVTILQGMGVAT